MTNVSALKEAYPKYREAVLEHLAKCDAKLAEDMPDSECNTALAEQFIADGMVKREEFNWDS